MKNQDQAPKKAPLKTAKNQPESASKPHAERFIEPLIPGCIRPAINDLQACSIIALAIHNARPYLETICSDFLANGLPWQAAGISETIAIAGAIVRYHVLQCMDADFRPQAPVFDLPGLTGIRRLSWEDALHGMSFTLCNHAESILCISCGIGRVQVELAEAIVIAEEILHLTGCFTERDCGRGTDHTKPTAIQGAAWRFKQVALAGHGVPRLPKAA